MKGTVDYKWETAFLHVSARTGDTDVCFSQSTKVKFIIQPKTKPKTLSSKVFICTPLSLWQKQISVCSVKLMQLYRFSMMSHDI